MDGRVIEDTEPCAVCGEPGTYGGHGVKNGELVSFTWCNSHKGVGLSCDEAGYVDAPTGGANDGA